MKTIRQGIILLLLASITQLTHAQTMTKYQFTAKGTFEVKAKPENQNKVGDLSFGTYSIEKIFNGDLVATSSFQMLTVGAADGAGAYVALEQVNGTLNGKSGSFVVMHNGTRTANSQNLTLTIVPGCSTGALAGMEGTIAITVVGKEHSYVVDYNL